LTEESSSRPKKLFHIISELEYSTAGHIDMEGIINVSLDELPDLDRFGKDWVAFLKKQKASAVASRLLREGVRLFEGSRGLEILAREKGDQFPGSYVEWLTSLKRERAYVKMIEAAQLGLKNLPSHLEIRATIADYLLEAARERNRRDLGREALKQALYASPSLARLLNPLDVAKGPAERVNLIREARSRFHEIERRRRPRSASYDFTRSADLAESHVPEYLEICCFLLMGDYEEVASLMVKAKPLGWTFGQTHSALAVPFFLHARWNPKRSLAANMNELWKEATESRMLVDGFSCAWDGRSAGELGIRFRTHLDNTLHEKSPDEKDLQRYFLQAERAATRRVDAIVGEKHRGSYWKAAQLLLAVAETWWSNDRREKGEALIQSFRTKYNRHSAFQRELKLATRKSGIFMIG
jgi:hypothetical protein